MKIVVAPNAFKGSLTATEAAQATAQGIRHAYPEAVVIEVPVADGGDGLVDVAAEALHGEIRRVTVIGPRFDPVDASICHIPEMKFGAVEMALASGLTLLPADLRDPTQTTTLGTGELIAAALDLGVSRIAVGIGGSATNDGGIGMATALGARFLDKGGEVVEPTGGALGRIESIDLSGLDRRIEDVRVEAVCDVDNPLCGPNGAAFVYGPQKGANSEQVSALDTGLAHLADVIERDLAVDVRNMPGAGAAGGLGAGLVAFLGARLVRGIDLVLDLVELENKLEGADLVLTGEGQIDFQTAFGKAPAGVAKAAKKKGVPCVAIAGSLGDKLQELHAVGIDAVFSLCPGPISLQAAIANGFSNLAAATEQAVRCRMSGRNPGQLDTQPELQASQQPG